MSPSCRRFSASRTTSHRTGCMLPPVGALVAASTMVRMSASLTSRCGSSRRMARVVAMASKTSMGDPPGDRCRVILSDLCAVGGSAGYALGGGPLGGAAQHTELIAFGIGQHRPAGAVRLPAVRHHGGAQPEQALDLTVAGAIGLQIDVDPVLDHLRFRHALEEQL